jgi:membrane protein YqaA with SNARE-associated domain
MWNRQIITSDKWFFVDREAFDKIWEFLKLGIPASSMLVIELWGYDMICIFSGWLGLKQLAA